MWLKARTVDLFKLKRIPAPHQKELSKVHITYRDIGQGLPVFCIPSWPQCSAEFIPLAEAVSDHIRVIAPDLPGWGGYSTPRDFNASVENYALIVEEFIESFGFKHFAIIGYSFGGAVAQLVCHNRKTLPQKLILISSLHSGRYIKKHFSRIFKIYHWARWAGLPPEFFKNILKRRFAAKLRESHYIQLYGQTDSFKKLAEEVSQANPYAAIDAMESLFASECLKKFKKQTDTLVLYGENDIPFVKEESHEIAMSLDVEPLLIEGANHDHFFFDVNKSADIILNFLLA